MTKLTKTALAPLFLAATLAACGAPNSDEGISKSEARATALGEWSTDYCAAEGWYDDGVCDDFCPEEDAACDVDPDDCDCGPQPAIAMVCDDGSVAASVCERNEAGVCEAGFECPAPDTCECGEAPLAAWMCEDGSTGTYQCVISDDGCGYEPTCGDDGGEPDSPNNDDGDTQPGDPGVDPEPGELCDDCGEIPAIAMLCDDDTTADTVCRVSEDGVCRYRFECPE